MGIRGGGNQVRHAGDHPARVRKLIGDLYQPCQGGMDVYWSGYFSLFPAPDEFPDVISDGGAWLIKVDGEITSQAVSIRQNEKLAEAYVETGLRFRQRDFGKQVVAA